MNRAHRWITVRVAVERSGLSERTIRGLIAKGVLPVIRPAGLRAVRIDQSVFERVMVHSLRPVSVDR